MANTYPGRKVRKPIQDMIAELRSWLPNYDHGEKEYPTLVWRLLASMPGGDEAEDMGYEPFNISWQEIAQLGDMLNAVQDKGDVEDLVAGLMSEEDPEDLEEARRRPRHHSREGDDVSDQQIIALKREAAMAGDREMAAICDRALGGSAQARRRCIEVIRSAQAQGDNAPSKRNLDEMFNAYVETALWSSTAEDDTPLDRLDAEVADSALASMRKDVESFARENAHLIESADVATHRYGRWGRAGHDFWLTRNGHGAGFWDGDWEPEATAERLTDAAHAYGETYLYVGDDGMIYSD